MGSSGVVTVSSKLFSGVIDEVRAHFHLKMAKTLARQSFQRAVMFFLLLWNRKKSLNSTFQKTTGLQIFRLAA